jgi:hypothetical protein
VVKNCGDLADCSGGRMRMKKTIRNNCAVPNVGPTGVCVMLSVQFS